LARVDIFLDEVPAYAVREGIVYVTTDDGWTLAMPLAKFRRAMARAGRALAEHDARKAEVVPLEGRKRRR
jgi:hypothetical protein